MKAIRIATTLCFLLSPGTYGQHEALERVTELEARISEARLLRQECTREKAGGERKWQTLALEQKKEFLNECDKVFPFPLSEQEEKELRELRPLAIAQEREKAAQVEQDRKLRDTAMFGEEKDPVKRARMVDGTLTDCLLENPTFRDDGSFWISALGDVNNATNESWLSDLRTQCFERWAPRASAEDRRGLHRLREAGYGIDPRRKEELHAAIGIGLNSWILDIKEWIPQRGHYLHLLFVSTERLLGEMQANEGHTGRLQDKGSLVQSAASLDARTLDRRTRFLAQAGATSRIPGLTRSDVTLRDPTALDQVLEAYHLGSMSPHQAALKYFHPTWKTWISEVQGKGPRQWQEGVSDISFDAAARIAFRELGYSRDIRFETLGGEYLAWASNGLYTVRVSYLRSANGPQPLRVSVVSPLAGNVNYLVGAMGHEAMRIKNSMENQR